MNYCCGSIMPGGLPKGRNIFKKGGEKCRDRFYAASEAQRGEWLQSLDGLVRSAKFAPFLQDFFSSSGEKSVVVDLLEKVEIENLNLLFLVVACVAKQRSLPREFVNVPVIRERHTLFPLIIVLRKGIDLRDSQNEVFREGIEFMLKCLSDVTSLKEAQKAIFIRDLSSEYFSILDSEFQSPATTLATSSLRRLSASVADMLKSSVFGSSKASLPLPYSKISATPTPSATSPTSSTSATPATVVVSPIPLPTESPELTTEPQGQEICWTSTLVEKYMISDYVITYKYNPESGNRLLYILAYFGKIDRILKYLDAKAPGDAGPAGPGPSGSEDLGEAVLKAREAILHWKNSSGLGLIHFLALSRVFKRGRDIEKSFLKIFKNFPVTPEYSACLVTSVTEKCAKVMVERGELNFLEILQGTRGRLTKAGIKKLVLPGDFDYSSLCEVSLRKGIGREMLRADFRKEGDDSQESSPDPEASFAAPEAALLTTDAKSTKLGGRIRRAFSTGERGTGSISRVEQPTSPPLGIQTLFGAIAKLPLNRKIEVIQRELSKGYLLTSFIVLDAKGGASTEYLDNLARILSQAKEERVGFSNLRRELLLKKSLSRGKGCYQRI